MSLPDGRIGTRGKHKKTRRLDVNVRWWLSIRSHGAAHEAVDITAAGALATATEADA